MAHSTQIFVLLAIIASLAFCNPIDTNAPISTDPDQQASSDEALIAQFEAAPQRPRQARQYYGIGGYPGYGGGGYSGSSAYASANSGAGGFGMYPGFGGGYSGSSATASANSGAGGFYGKK